MPLQHTELEMQMRMQQLGRTDLLMKFLLTELAMLLLIDQVANRVDKKINTTINGETTHWLIVDNSTRI